MTFAHPWMLPAACAAAALFLLAYRRSERVRAQDALTYSNLDFLLRSTGATPWPARALALVSSASAGMLVAAAAGPQIERSITPPLQLVVCVDTSGSMASTDIKPSRELAAREALTAFIKRDVHEGSIGLVTFAADAKELAAPANTGTAAEALRGIPPANGPTAIGDAIALAQRMLPRNGPRAIALLTDGVSNVGSDPMRAARSAGFAGIRLYTIGIGTGHGVVPGTHDSAGIDERALRAYAEATGGNYQRAPDANTMEAALAAVRASALPQRGSIDLSCMWAIGSGAMLALITLVCLGPGLRSKLPEL